MALTNSFVPHVSIAMEAQKPKHGSVTFGIETQPVEACGGELIRRQRLDSPSIKTLRYRELGPKNTAPASSFD
jgi:hypothetical protein